MEDDWSDLIEYVGPWSWILAYSEPVGYVRFWASNGYEELAVIMGLN